MSGFKSVNPAGFKLEQCPVDTAPSFIQRDMLQSSELDGAGVKVVVQTHMPSNSCVHLSEFPPTNV